MEYWLNQLTVDSHRQKKNKTDKRLDYKNEKQYLQHCAFVCVCVCVCGGGVFHVFYSLFFPCGEGVTTLESRVAPVCPVPTSRGCTKAFLLECASIYSVNLCVCVCGCVFVCLAACISARLSVYNLGSHIVLSGVCAANLYALCDLLTANPAKYIIPLGLSLLLGVRNQYVWGA